MPIARRDEDHWLEALVIHNSCSNNLVYLWLISISPFPEEALCIDYTKQQLIHILRKLVQKARKNRLEVVGWQRISIAGFGFVGLGVSRRGQ